MTTVACLLANVNIDATARTLLIPTARLLAGGFLQPVSVLLPLHSPGIREHQSTLRMDAVFGIGRLAADGTAWAL